LSQASSGQAASGRISSELGGPSTNPQATSTGQDFDPSPDASRSMKAVFRAEGAGAEDVGAEDAEKGSIKRSAMRTFLAWSGDRRLSVSLQKNETSATDPDEYRPNRGPKVKLHRNTMLRRIIAGKQEPEARKEEAAAFWLLVSGFQSVRIRIKVSSRPQRRAQLAPDQVRGESRDLPFLLSSKFKERSRICAAAPSS